MKNDTPTTITIEKIKTLKFKNEYQTRENLENELMSVLDTIKDGQVYAQVVSVSSSGMSRKIKFYRVIEQYQGKPSIENITAHIAWLRNIAPIGQYVTKSGLHYCDTGLKVDGCGMDMVFHTLYSCMVYSEAKEWNQNYRTL